MDKLSDITILGTGKVAKSLSNMFFKQGMLKEIYGRNTHNAKNLIQDSLSNVNITDSLDFVNSESDTFILCVNDSSIAHLAEQLILPPKAVLLHTSGAMAIDVLSTKGYDCGVFYPVQTFGEEVIHSLEKVPVLIDANNDVVYERVKGLAEKLSQKVYRATQIERERLHVSAVFASNFTNRMIHASHQVLSQTQLPFDLLEPLIYQSIGNAILHGPQNSLTGPAKRKDQSTIDKHLDILTSRPDLQVLYRTLTQYILKDNT